MFIRRCPCTDLDWRRQRDCSCECCCPGSEALPCPLPLTQHEYPCVPWLFSLACLIPARPQIANHSWIDLPKQHKLVEASYQELTAAEIPAAHPSEGVTIKVVCGETDGSESEGVVISPVRPLGGCWFLDVQLKNKGDEVFQRIPKGWNTFVYQLEGDINYGDDAASLPIAKYHTSVFSNEDDQEGIRIKAASEGGARVVVVAGEPLDQEIVQHGESMQRTGKLGPESSVADSCHWRTGPFVMDSRAGIQQAFMDYQMGRNGFVSCSIPRSRISR